MGGGKLQPFIYLCGHNGYKHSKNITIRHRTLSSGAKKELSEHFYLSTTDITQSSANNAPYLRPIRIKNTMQKADTHRQIAHTLSPHIVT